MNDKKFNAYAIEQLLLVARDYCADIEMQTTAVKKQKNAKKRLSELNLLMFEVSRNIEKIITLIDVSIDHASDIQQQ